MKDMNSRNVNQSAKRAYASFNALRDIKRTKDKLVSSKR